MSEHELIETDGGEALVPGPAPLSPKELKFCEAFANPESGTFGNARKSAEAAGYREPHNAGWKLRRRGRIIAKLQEYHGAVFVAVGRVLADLENERRLAVEKGDLASAIRASELMGKHLGMFLERSIFAVADPGTYDPVRAQQVRQITAYLLTHPPLLDAPVSAAVEAIPAAQPTRASPELLQALQTQQESE